ncbi:class I SAM-dependent methyltransferase [Saccharopolyspora dendranthemae]|uniref:Phosphatidylethanolamine N-methyltransferase /phosphatidyl-N-methylethanolamine N-methyltransferase n=1 Tax=Saccharopolyspora dendranthemae TaxID=1181886 RepID=A0A561U9P1_9PSEU|nr:class I SAM-dependent methyltransferase [Saccharopolyspora dendranthemae]TWF96075.1 phosphatidylethanolamine N-methyltransferase /phosphatidyl-N-methylethanolamine N-methyltransferase [Saccharopolyspora dendranthemae]
MDGQRSEKLRRYWDNSAASYDGVMARFDRYLARDSRQWVCSRAWGDVLEVAVGTGLNLPLYPAGTRLTAIEWSPGMLRLAQQRRAELGVEAELREGDARSLQFPDGAFDTVVCTFSLCAIPDHEQAIAEMHRVLRPDGVLLLADHVVSTAWPVRVVQRLAELVTVPKGGEHFRRRPSQRLPAAGFEVTESERFKLGLIERLAAGKRA